MALRFPRRGWIAAPIAAAGLGALAAATAGTAAPPAESGLVCTTRHTGTHASAFDLVAKAGNIITPDADSLAMWGFAESGHGYQYPSPFLCVTEGDSVTITLRNDLDVPTSIIFPGITGVLADGQPSQPETDAGTGDTSLAPVVPAHGSTTYTFVASRPGTYIYESGTDQARQVNMGLFGGLIVHPASDTPTAKRAYGANTSYKPGQEYALLLSDIDPELHIAAAKGQKFDMARYRPRYFFLNGRSFPDTLAPNGASWLPSQPYGSLVHIEQYDVDDNPLPALVRFLNVSSVQHPFHPHANHVRLVGRDGAPVVDGASDRSTLHYSVPISPGQTWDMLYDWTDVDAYDPSTNPVQTLVPATPDRDHPGGESYWSGSPYLGKTGPMQAGVAVNNQCGEYYHVAHSHALQEATNYGASMGGMLTLIRIDPLGGCK